MCQNVLEYRYSTAPLKDDVTYKESIQESQAESESKAASSIQNLQVRDWCIVIYDSVPFPGEVKRVMSAEYEVKVMHRLSFLKRAAENRSTRASWQLRPIQAEFLTVQFSGLVDKKFVSTLPVPASRNLQLCKFSFDMSQA